MNATKIEWVGGKRDSEFDVTAATEAMIACEQYDWFDGLSDARSGVIINMMF